MTTGRRGRPAILHDNRRVKAFLLHVMCAPKDPDGSQVVATPRWVGDILVGSIHLQTEGQKSTRPLCKRRLIRVLAQCDDLTTAHVAEALYRDYSPAAVKRYRAAAVVASKGIEREMDRHQWRDWRQELDAPFWEDAGRAEAMSMTAERPLVEGLRKGPE